MLRDPRYGRNSELVSAQEHAAPSRLAPPTPRIVSRPTHPAGPAADFARSSTNTRAVLQAVLSQLTHPQPAPRPCPPCPVSSPGQVGECPFLAGEYGIAYTKGMQQLPPLHDHLHSNDNNANDSNVNASAGQGKGHRPQHPRRLKMLSYLKHFTAYGVETGRYTFVANVTDFDFWDRWVG